eukprot:1889186-Pleurochrysis_carterae.AAC.3
MWRKRARRRCGWTAFALGTSACGGACVCKRAIYERSNRHTRVEESRVQSEKKSQHRSSGLLCTHVLSRYSSSRLIAARLYDCKEDPIYF